MFVRNGQWINDTIGSILELTHQEAALIGVRRVLIVNSLGNTGAKSDVYGFLV